MSENTAGAFTPDEVDELQRRHLQALSANDLDTLTELFADDLMHVHYDGRRDTKDSYLAPLRTGEVRYTELRQLGNRTVRIFADTAIITGDLYWSAESEGRTADGKTTYSSVWARRDGRPVQVLWHSAALAS